MTAILILCFGLLDVALVALISAFTFRFVRIARERFSHSREMGACVLVAIWSTYGAAVAFLIGYCGIAIATGQF